MRMSFAVDSEQWVNVSHPIKAVSKSFNGHLIKFSRDSILLEGKLEVCYDNAEESLDVYAMTSSPHRFITSFQIQKSNHIKCKLLSESQHKVLGDLAGVIRKSQHIHICKEMNVESHDKYTGFSKLHFKPKTIPECNFDDCNTQVSLLGTTFNYPMMIAGMTGGIKDGVTINQRLATIAEKYRIPMGIGSQRIALENKNYENIFKLKDHFPKLYLIGNLGGSQLLSNNAFDQSQRAIDMIQADALAIHINVIQELVQIEGDRTFKGIFKKIESICNKIKVPIIVKEVGAGMDPETAIRLENIGVSAIDVGGRGGTSWGYIEGLRSDQIETKKLGETFRNWGIPTAYSLAALTSAGIKIPLIATGGIRDGLTVAKACAMGAHTTGIGLPMLKAATESLDKVESILTSFINELKITMVASGSQDISSLKNRIQLGLPFENDFYKF